MPGLPVLRLLHGPIPTTTSWRCAYPKHRPWRHPPGLHPTPPHRTRCLPGRQPTSGRRPAGLSGQLYVQPHTSSRPIEPPCCRLTPARATLGSTSGSEPYYCLSPQPLGLRTGNKTCTETTPIRKRSLLLWAGWIGSSLVRRMVHASAWEPIRAQS